MSGSVEIDAVLGSEPFSYLDHQTLEGLTACYKGGSWRARQVIHGAFESRSPAWRVAAFGAAVRRSIHLIDVPDSLLGANLATPAQLPTTALKVEYVWFLFSQRAWKDILAFVGQTEPHDRLAFPGHVADIYFLAFVRSQVDRIAQGVDVDGFRQKASEILTFIRISWPDMLARQDLYGAIVRHIQGDIADARAELAKVVGGPFIGPLEAAGHVLPAGGMRANPEADHLSIYPSDRRAVSLVSLDRGYFDQFAHAAAARYVETNRENGLHFHCVGFDPSNEIRAWSLPISVGVTVDSRDISTLTANQRVGYFAGARYLHLPHYLPHYDAIHVCDIDGFVTRDIRTVEHEMGSADVGLSSRVLDPGRRLARMPWEAIAAGSLLIRSTAGGALFADAVAAYLAEALDRALKRGRPFWYADQNALFYSWYDLKDRVQFMRLQPPVFRQENSWALFEEIDQKLEFIKSHQISG